MDNPTYTIQQLASRAGVSVRTLHYYDELGLLPPTTRAANNYRLYTQADMLQIEQILFFRSLGFGLKKIKEIVTDPHFDRTAALRDQRRYLELEINRLTQVIQIIDQTPSEKGQLMTNRDNSDIQPTQKQLADYKAEARQRWGHTSAWQQSQTRTKHWTKTDYAKLKQDGAEFMRQFADLVEAGAQPSDAAIQAMIDQHHAGIERFYDCPPQMYRSLGAMYVDDPRFAAYYNQWRPGLAIFMRDAINYYCDARSKQSGTIT